MSILNHSIVFNDEDLLSLEELLHSSSKFSHIGENAKNVIRKACSDYRLLKKYLPAKGLTRQVIFFLLDPVSNTTQGIINFFEKLQVWIEVVSEEEQELYQEVLEYYEPSEYWEPEDLLEIRNSLMSVVLELQPRFDTKIPMQSYPSYSVYETWMMNFGDEYGNSTVYDLVPDLKGKGVPADLYQKFLEQSI